MKRVVALVLACLMALPARAQEPSSTAPVRVRITGVNTYEIPGVARLEGDRINGTFTRITDSLVQVKQPGDGRLLTVLRAGQDLTGLARVIGDGLVEFYADGDKEALYVPLDAIARTEFLEAPAATSFNELMLLVKPGATVTVRDSTGREITGKLDTLSPASLALLTAGTRREWPESDVVTVRQRRSAVVIGLAIGAGIGLVFGLAASNACYYSNSCGSEPGTLLLVLPAVFAGMGAGVGALITDQHVIYKRRGGAAAFNVAPIVAHGKRGVALSVAFR